MSKCTEARLSEEDAKNKAVLKTRSLRSKRTKLGNSLPQAKAYKCYECDAWHVKILFPRETTPKEVIPIETTCPE